MGMVRGGVLGERQSERDREKEEREEQSVYIYQSISETCYDRVIYLYFTSRERL
jgi:hypothetical protein